MKSMLEVYEREHFLIKLSGGIVSYREAPEARGSCGKYLG